MRPSSHRPSTPRLRFRTWKVVAVGVAILVLAASSSVDGPGPLVTAFATRSGGNALRLPVTIIPGAMTDAEIEAVC